MSGTEGKFIVIPDAEPYKHEEGKDRGPSRLGEELPERLGECPSAAFNDPV